MNNMLVLFIIIFVLTVIAGFIIAFGIKKLLIVCHPEYKGEKIKFFSRENWKIPKIFTEKKQVFTTKKKGQVIFLKGFIPRKKEKGV